MSVRHFAEEGARASSRALTDFGVLLADTRAPVPSGDALVVGFRMYVGFGLAPGPR